METIESRMVSMPLAVSPVEVSASEVRRAMTCFAIFLSLEKRGGTTALASFLSAGSCFRSCTCLPFAADAAKLCTRVLTCSRIGSWASSSAFSASKPGTFESHSAWPASLAAEYLSNLDLA